MKLTDPIKQFFGWHSTVLLCVEYSTVPLFSLLLKRVFSSQKIKKINLHDYLALVMILNIELYSEEIWQGG